MATIKINDDLKQKLKIKSDKTGISTSELANRYISEGLKEDDEISDEFIQELEAIEKDILAGNYMDLDEL